MIRYLHCPAARIGVRQCRPFLPHALLIVKYNVVVNSNTLRACRPCLINGSTGQAPSAQSRGSNPKLSLRILTPDEASFTLVFNRVGSYMYEDIRSTFEYRVEYCFAFGALILIRLFIYYRTPFCKLDASENFRHFSKCMDVNLGKGRGSLSTH